MTTRRFLGVSLLVFVVLTCVITWPQAAHLRDTVHDDGDPLLNTWALAWVAHQLPRAPAHLFDANIFYPERRTLAFSETLLLPSLVVAPLYWLGVGPILIYNLVFLSGFAISGVGVALLVRALTGRDGAAILAGIVFAFLPYRIDHYAHMQLQQTQCLPFAMWAFHRVLRTGRWGDGVLFGAFVAGQILSCMYYGLLLVPYFAVVCGTLWIAAGPRRRRAVVPLAIAAAVVIAATFPVGKAYLGARKVVGERGRDEVVQGSAIPADYLGPPEENLLYGKLLAPFSRGERRLFPGFAALALGFAGLWPRRREDTKLVLAYGLGLLIAFDVSLGFNGFTYRVLYEYFLPFRGLRIPARNGIITGFSLAVLAGFGAARIRRPALVAALGAVLVAEYLSHDIAMMRIPPPPPAYADALRDNAGNPTAALFEFPVSSHDDPTYMYYSTFHWQHLVNGYSGFFPPSYVFLVNAVRDLPDDEAMHAIKSHGTRYLLVHGERLFGDRYVELVDALKRRPELTLVSITPSETAEKHAEIALFRVSYAERR